MSRLVRVLQPREQPDRDPGGEADGVSDDHPHYVSRPRSHRDAAGRSRGVRWAVATAIAP